MSQPLLQRVSGILALSARRLTLLAGAALLATTLQAGAQTCEDPKVIRFSLIPSQESVRELSLYKPVLDLLARNTGKKIEFYLPTSYSSVVEALLGKWVDIAVLGPESYVIARNKDASVEVFGTYFKKKNGIQDAGPGYKSLLISRRNSKYTSIEAARGAVMLLVDPASTSGSLIPDTVFAQKVVKTPLKQYFSRVAFSGGHDLSTLAVAEGKADVAFVASHRFMDTINAGKAKLEDFNVLWTSPLLPQDPFVMRNTLCAPLREKITQTFLGLASTPEGRRYLDNVDAERFVAMTDADYEIIREAGVR